MPPIKKPTLQKMWAELVAQATRNLEQGYIPPEKTEFQLANLNSIVVKTALGCVLLQVLIHGWQCWFLFSFKPRHVAVKPDKCYSLTKWHQLCAIYRSKEDM